MQKLSEEFIAKKQEEVNQAADAYVRSLYSLLGSIDLSQDLVEAHYILDRIGQIQKIHADLEKLMLELNSSAETAREEHGDTFNRACW